MYFIAGASYPGMDVYFLVILELEGFVNTLIFAVILYTKHDVNILGFIAKVEQFMADLVADGPFLWPVEVEFVFYETVAVVDKD
jgi:hypothetical protein